MKFSDEVSMRSHRFTFVVMVLIVGLQQIRLHFQESFSTEEIYRRQVIFLQGELERQVFRHQVTGHQLTNIKKYIARLKPLVSDGTEGGSEVNATRLDFARLDWRGPANVSSRGGESGLFKRGKGLFEGRQYAASAKVLAEFIETYPYSPQVVDSMFLLVESYFLMDRYVECLTTVEQLVDLYPKNPLTGYALLRMSEIYVRQGRRQEAVEIYKTVLRAFPYRGLASQVKEAMRSTGW